MRIKHRISLSSLVRSILFYLNANDNNLPKEYDTKCSYECLIAIYQLGNLKGYFIFYKREHITRFDMIILYDRLSFCFYALNYDKFAIIKITKETRHIQNKTRSTSFANSFHSEEMTLSSSFSSIF